MTKVRKTKLTTKDVNKNFQEKLIYVNEHLTVKRKQIMYEARKLKYEKAYKFLWSRNGRIFMRKDERANVIEIRDFEDLNKIV